MTNSCKFGFMHGVFVISTWLMLLFVYLDSIRAQREITASLARIEKHLGIEAPAKPP